MMLLPVGVVSRTVPSRRGPVIRELRRAAARPKMGLLAVALRTTGALLRAEERPSRTGPPERAGGEAPRSAAAGRRGTRRRGLGSRGGAPLLVAPARSERRRRSGLRPDGRRGRREGTGAAAAASRRRRRHLPAPSPMLPPLYIYEQAPRAAQTQTSPVSSPVLHAAVSAVRGGVTARLHWVLSRSTCRGRDIYSRLHLHLDPTRIRWD